MPVSQQGDSPHKQRNHVMKTQITAIVTAASIAFSGATVTPAQAAPSTEQQIMLLLFGAIAGAAIANGVGAHGGHAPAPVPAPVPAPAPRPVTFSTGPINVMQTYSFDLDNGMVTSGRRADIWFEAVNYNTRYLVPVNGAQISLQMPRSAGRNRGYAGCSTSVYSANRVNLNRVPVGSYVCVKTSAGRFSEFRVNNLTGGRNKTLHIGYTTWQ